MRLEVVVDAAPERVGPEIALDHPQHRRALFVRDGVERLVDLRRRVDGLMHRMGRRQRVEGQGPLVVERLVDGDVPVGPDGGERTAFHPVGEALVQPDVVPPLHRHEIAEPLVGHLVREDGRNALARGERRVLRIDEEVAFAVENGRRVLHRAGGEVGLRD